MGCEVSAVQETPSLSSLKSCKAIGADVTCGEMAMCTNLLQGQALQRALLRRHKSEDLFGVQICGAYPDTVARTAEIIDLECSVDFIDINMGCPIDLVVNKGAGSALLTKPLRMKIVISAACTSSEKPIIVKPWLFIEIKEQRHWDISSGERLDILKDYVRFGLEHWGSDAKVCFRMDNDGSRYERGSRALVELLHEKNVH
ncbi:hypothetical protein RND81_02G129600 [Saponaria officinalis]|uniref:tRNA-dihydrouridine(47) synthase [NAD(P)(+)] n=1 Tax=Saponaria officinalis TaxID=3572 RepID=A0AAW1MQ60_SAPOF